MHRILRANAQESLSFTHNIHIDVLLIYGDQETTAVLSVTVAIAMFTGLVLDSCQPAMCRACGWPSAMLTATGKTLVLVINEPLLCTASHEQPIYALCC